MIYCSLQDDCGDTRHDRLDTPAAAIDHEPVDARFEPRRDVGMVKHGFGHVPDAWVDIRQ